MEMESVPVALLSIAVPSGVFVIYNQEVICF